MKITHRTPGVTLTALAMAALTSCGSGSSGSAEGGTVTLSFLMGNAKTTKHLDAAKKFLAFVASPPATDIDGWRQQAYEIELSDETGRTITSTGRVCSSH